jgi:hypothetical protein
VEIAENAENSYFPSPRTSDPGAGISPQMTQIAQIRRPQNGFICDIYGPVFKQFSWEVDLYTDDADYAPKVLGAGALRFRRTLWRIFLSQ